MRAYKFGPFSPVTANTTALNAGTFTSTGAAVAPTTQAVPDGLAHQITLTSPVQATLAGTTFTVTGTDADGYPQSEGIAGPASASTVTTTKYFKTVSSVQPSITMGGLLLSIGIGAASLSPTAMLTDKLIAAPQLSLVVTGVINATVNDTIADVTGSQPALLPWTAIAALTAKTANTDGAARFPASGVQILTNSVTNGATIALHIAQPTACQP